MIIQIASYSKIFYHIDQNWIFSFSWTAVISNFNSVFCLIHESFGEIFATVITIEFKVFFMNNFYVHFQIVQIFCHIDHNWISFFMNSCTMFLQSNILYEIFVHSSQLYFSNPLWTFSIMHFKKFFDNFFLQILHLNFVNFWKC